MEEKIKSLFKTYQVKLGKSPLAIFRQEGILVAGEDPKDTVDFHSLGALAAGVWQAAESMQKLIRSGESSEYALGFSNSHSGFYILPIQTYLFVCSYSKKLNPGKLKFHLKLLGFELRKILAPEALDESSNEDQSFLFHDISDEEIDKLFSFPGS